MRRLSTSGVITGSNSGPSPSQLQVGTWVRVRASVRRTTAHVPLAVPFGFQLVVDQCLRRDGSGRRSYRRTPCPRAFLAARPHRGRVPDGSPRAAIGLWRPMRVCAPDAVGLLLDMRRLSGYYRAAEHCSSTEPYLTIPDMIGCAQGSHAIPRSAVAHTCGPHRPSSATAQHCCFRFRLR